MIVTVDILKDIEDIQKETSRVKGAFREYIKDKRIPLEERWKVFKEAPFEMKEHPRWIIDFKSFPKEVVWYDHFYIDRHETVCMYEIVERIRSDLTSWKEGRGECEIHHKTGIDFESLKELQEEILEKNLGSFLNDW